jgi:hypothetical protein
VSLSGCGRVSCWRCAGRTSTWTTVSFTFDKRAHPRAAETARSRRTVPLPARSARILHMHRAQQVMEMLALGPAWTDAGLVFASSIGMVEPRN